jgi:hypothetical protein
MQCAPRFCLRFAYLNLLLFLPSGSWGCPFFIFFSYKIFLFQGGAYCVMQRAPLRFLELRQQPEPRNTPLAPKPAGSPAMECGVQGMGKKPNIYPVPQTPVFPKKNVGSLSGKHREFESKTLGV